MRTAILLPLLLAGIGGCATTPDDSWAPGQDETELDSRIDGKADGQGCGFNSLSGLTAMFGYQSIDAGNGWTWYRKGVALDSGVTLSDGSRLEIGMYFLPGNRVVIDYAESATRQGVFDFANDTLVVTTVSVDGSGNVRLGNVAHGVATEQTQNGHCTAGLALTFDADLRTAGLTNKATTIWAGKSTAWAADPDHLDAIPNADGRAYYKQAIASGEIQVQRR